MTNTHQENIPKNHTTPEIPSSFESAIVANLDELSFQFANNPVDQYKLDIQLLGLAKRFFNALEKFHEDYEQAPFDSLGFRRKEPTKIGITECVLLAKELSQFCSQYLFAVSEQTNSNLEKKQIAFEIKKNVEAFRSLVREFFQVTELTKDKAAILVQFSNETSMAMSLMITNLTNFIMHAPRQTEP